MTYNNDPIVSLRGFPFSITSELIKACELLGSLIKVLYKGSLHIGLVKAVTKTGLELIINRQAVQLNYGDPALNPQNLQLNNPPTFVHNFL